MVTYILKKSLNVLARKPIMLWGVSLLFSVITAIVSVMGSSVPIITVPVILALSAGMSALYLSGYNGGEVNSKRLFDGFTEGRAPRVIGGMCWYKLWSIIWAFVPVVGIVKSYSYAFTPYILLTRPDVSATDALKASMDETKGVKLTMFLTDLLVSVSVILAAVILALLAFIPFIGVLFSLVLALYIIAIIMFLPLLNGIIHAAFYEETRNGSLRTINQFTKNFKTTVTINPDAPKTDWFCTACGTSNVAGTSYCRACGTKHEAPKAPDTPEAPEAPAAETPAPETPDKNNNVQQ